LTIRAPHVAHVGAGPGLSVIHVEPSADVGVSVDVARTAPGLPLAADVRAGDRDVRLRDAGHPLVPGSWILLQDDRPYAGSILTRIAGVDDDAIHLESASPVSVERAAGGRLHAYADPPLLEGIELRDVRIESAAGVSARHAALVLMSRTYGAVIANVRVGRSIGPLIVLRNAYGTRVERSVLEDAESIAGTGVEGQQCTSCAVRDLHVARCAFGVVFSQSPFAEIAHNTIGGRLSGTARGRGIKVQNGSAFSRVTGNTIADAGLFGIYSSDSEGVLVSGNTIVGTGTDPLQHGIQVGGYLSDAAVRNVIATNVVAHVAGDGIAVNPTNGATSALSTLVLGNQVNAAGGHGIQLSASRSLVVGNAVDGAAGDAVRVDSGTAGNVVDLTLSDPGARVPSTRADRPSQAHAIVPLFGPAPALDTSTVASAPGAFFPGRSRYPPTATFTVHLVIEAVHGGTATYQLLDERGAPIGSPLATTTTEPALRSLTIPAAALSTAATVVSGRLSSSTGVARLHSAVILVEW
jgi:parallel beta-helix repeat protein